MNNTPNMTPVDRLTELMIYTEDGERKREIERVRDAVVELVEAARVHEREYTSSGQHHNVEGIRYKATVRLRAALARFEAQS